MTEALLYEKLNGSQVRCNVCQWRCAINPGKLGVCRMYQNDGGTLHNLNYALVSSVAADPVEKKPLFHFFPGSLAFSVGSWGCNFRCEDCQNWEISCVEEANGTLVLKPQDAIEMAMRYNCQGIAWTYNEPAIWF